MSSSRRGTPPTPEGRVRSIPPRKSQGAGPTHETPPVLARRHPPIRRRRTRLETASIATGLLTWTLLASLSILECRIALVASITLLASGLAAFLLGHAALVAVERAPERFYLGRLAYFGLLTGAAFAGLAMTVLVVGLMNVFEWADDAGDQQAAEAVNQDGATGLLLYASQTGENPTASLDLYLRMEGPKDTPASCDCNLTLHVRTGNGSWQPSATTAVEPGDFGPVTVTHPSHVGTVHGYHWRVPMPTSIDCGNGIQRFTVMVEVRRPSHAFADFDVIRC